MITDWNKYLCTYLHLSNLFFFFLLYSLSRRHAFICNNKTFERNRNTLTFVQSHTIPRQSNYMFNLSHESWHQGIWSQGWAILMLKLDLVQVVWRWATNIFWNRLINCKATRTFLKINDVFSKMFQCVCKIICTFKMKQHFTPHACNIFILSFKRG